MHLVLSLLLLKYRTYIVNYSPVLHTGHFCAYSVNTYVLYSVRLGYLALDSCRIGESRFILSCGNCRNSIVIIADRDFCTLFNREDFAIDQVAFEVH